MSVDVAEVRHGTGTGRDVSGSTVHVLIGMVQAHRGEVGVAQVLALAGELRPFAELGDLSRWSSLTESVALFNAAALVTGDGAVGLHVGEVLLFTPDAAAFADRLRALGSTRAVMQHVDTVIGHFETTSTAATLEIAADHALVEVVPRRERRHAHLCEMTRGLLSQIPVLFDAEPALITETECSARGGRRCLYAVSWEVTETELAGERPAVSDAMGRGSTAPANPRSGGERRIPRRDTGTPRREPRPCATTVSPRPSSESSWTG